MAELIPVMRQTMLEFSNGGFAQPPRRMLEVSPHGGFFGSMPAASADSLGAKLVAFYPGNADKNLHTHLATIVLFRPETGEPIAIMDGRLITEMHTSAVTATYIDAVAGSDVKTLAILGAGTQGKESHRGVVTRAELRGKFAYGIARGRGQTNSLQTSVATLRRSRMRSTRQR